MEELEYDITEEQHNCDKNIAQLNLSQQQAFDDIVEDKKLDPATAYFFLNGLAGIGKTFFHTIFFHHFWAKGKIVFYIASLDVAALLFPGRKTSYITFKILIDINKLSKSQIPKQLILAGLMKNTTIIVWDEVPIQDKHSFATTNRTIENIKDNDKSFLVRL